MTRQFVDPGAAFEDAAERASGMTERQFLKRLLALVAAGEVEATGFRLQSGHYVDPLERLGIPPEDWREALLVKNQSRVASDRPSGWILIRDGGDRWAGVRVSVDDVLAIWTRQTKPAARPARYASEKRSRAEALVATVYPGGVPSPEVLSSATLVREVRSSSAFLALSAKEKPSDDTILRAAGRKAN